MAMTSSGRLVKTSAQFTREQHAWLLERARLSGETVAVILRQIIRAAMDAERAEAA